MVKTSTPPSADMDRDYPGHPLPAVVAVVVRGSQVLLVRRNKGTVPDKWGFPGGLVEVGETLRQAACRELLEETSIHAEAADILDVMDIIVPDDHGRIRTHFILTAIRCHWRSGEAVAASDAAEARWYGLDAIAGMPCHPNLPRLAALVLGAATPGNP